MNRKSVPSSPLADAVRPFIRRASPTVSPSVNAIIESHAEDAERRLAFLDEADRVAVALVLAGLLKVEQDSTDVYGMVRTIATRVDPTSAGAFKAFVLELPDRDAHVAYGYLDASVNAAFALGLAVGRRLGVVSEGARS